MTRFFGRTAGRGVSPALFALGVICFFFAFAGVSCNTDAAQQTLNGASALGGSQRPQQVQALRECLSALKGTDIFTYSGITLVTGAAPRAISTLPGPCRTGQQGVPGGDSATSADNGAIGVQPLAIVAFAATVIALGVGLWALLRPLRSPLQFLVMTGLALVALLMLVLNQSHVENSILAKVDAVATGNGAPFSLRDYFDVHPEPAYWLALVDLGVAAVFSAAVGLLRPPPHERMGDGREPAGSTSDAREIAGEQHSAA